VTEETLPFEKDKLNNLDISISKYFIYLEIPDEITTQILDNCS